MTRSLVALFAILLIAMPIFALGVPTQPLANRAPSKLQPRAPQASKRMGMRKRAKVVAPKKKEYSSFLCPGGAIACPVHQGERASPESASTLQSQLTSLSDWFKVGFECIELDTELNQCGGCLALGQGQDCATIPNARVTGCEKGACRIYSCQVGFVLSKDGQACVRPGDDTANPQAVLAARRR